MNLDENPEWVYLKKNSEWISLQKERLGNNKFLEVYNYLFNALIKLEPGFYTSINGQVTWSGNSILIADWVTKDKDLFLGMVNLFINMGNKGYKINEQLGIIVCENRPPDIINKFNHFETNKSYYGDYTVKNSIKKKVAETDKHDEQMNLFE